MFRPLPANLRPENIDQNSSILRRKVVSHSVRCDSRITFKHHRCPWGAD